MNITVVGGGNIGMCLVGEISRVKGYNVTLYASHPESFSERIKVRDTEKNLEYLSGTFVTTDDIQLAVQNADVILITLPSFLRKDFIEMMTPYVNCTSCVGFVPAYGGAEHFCQGLLDKGATIFGFQKVPYVARTVERGKIAGLWSKKKKLLVGAIPASKTSAIAAMIEDMLLLPCDRMANFMEVTLLPGNPLLHTSGSYVYLKNYTPETYYPEQIYYYRSWTDECSEVICSYSNEMMEVCRKLPIDLSGVESIQSYYESPTPEALTKKFKSIPSFWDLTLPMIKTDKGFKPDFSSRFFTEDMPCGVSIIKALALLVDVKTPTIDKILSWYEKMTGIQYFKEDGTFGKDIAETTIPQNFGIDTVEKLKIFYER